MLDLKRTLELIKGAIFDPDATWAAYLPQAGDWKKTAMLLTGPLVVGSGVLGYLLNLVLPSRLPFYTGPTFISMIVGIIVAAVAAALVAFIFATFAGLFKGKNSFPLALAATSLAFVPGYLGNVLVHVPWIGGLIALGLGIYGLVLLWRILPTYLEVPASSRAGHYILSLVASIVVFAILGSIVGGSMMGSRASRMDVFQSSGALNESESGGAPTGLFGAMERQGRIMEQAGEDTYDPPDNGKLSRRQVENFVNVMGKTRDYKTAQTKELEELGKKADNNEIESLGEAFSGMAGVMGLTTAEMEVVKTGGGNWAEHQWVKEQLLVARLQKDINDAVKHNYKLYQQFEEELNAVGL